MSAIRWVLAHIWLAVIVLAALVALVLVFRGRVKRLMRLAKAAATDPRLPRSVRWLFVVGLAAKAMPVDFGIDEVALGLGVLLLSTKYRHIWREIREGIE
ncbi:MAG: hypothetical protein ACYDHP_08615 [Ferrimicrobium sp.]